MPDHILRETAIELLSQPITMSMCLSVDECHHKIAQQRIDRYLIENIPASDVLPRDEGIKLGAELAAMHGSDATSQELEKAYLEGVAEGMKRRDVKPVVRGKWMHKEITVDFHTVGQCSFCKERRRIDNFCPNCGADMRSADDG